MITIRETGELLPFGYANKYWNAFKSNYQSADEIYRATHRDNRFFIEEHILVRNGCVIDSLLGEIS